MQAPKTQGRFRTPRWRRARSSLRQGTCARYHPLHSPHRASQRKKLLLLLPPFTPNCDAVPCV
eukprot:3635883-Rhodomonas_salina.2